MEARTFPQPSTSTAAIRAVNVVVNRGGKLIGHNTDTVAVTASLEKVRFDVKGKKTEFLVEYQRLNDALAWAAEVDPAAVKAKIDQLDLGLLDAAVGRPDVIVTFDDGNLSDLEIGLPRLLERGLSALAGPVLLLLLPLTAGRHAR